MKFACQYAIIRFMPFLETGEFANVGIVLFCPRTGNFYFQISDNKTRKINSFFSPIPGRIYPTGIKEINAELLRIKKLIEESRQKDRYFTKKLFCELVRDRESLFRFSQIRGVLTDDMQQKTNELFTYYVERNFVIPEYIDQNLVKKVKNILGQDTRKLYKTVRVEKKGVRAIFPLGYKNDQGKLERIIKPLNLSHTDANDLFQNGWTWYGRLKKLRDVLPDKVLIAASIPTKEQEETFSIYQEIKHDLNDLSINVIDICDTKQIQEFARIQ